MSKRSLASLLAFGALTSVAAAQDIPSFDGLGVVETTTHTRDEVHRVFPVDLNRLDGDVQKLSDSVNTGFEQWKQIVTQSERTYNEGNSAPRPSVVLHFWDSDRFAAAQEVGAQFAATMHEAQRLVKRILTFFHENAAQRPETYVELLERHARVLELITLYNTLIDWGTSRSLDYDTLAPFDEKDVWILEPAQYELVNFPVLPRIVITTGVATAERTPGTMNGMSVEHDATVVTTTRTTFLQALDPSAVTPMVRAAEASISSATSAQTAIRGKLDEENTFTDDFGKKRLDVGSQQNFDAVKASSIEFAEAMARLKGQRNAAYSLLAGSDLLMAHEDLAADWKSINEQFDTLASWGEGSYIQYDGIGVRERNHTIFHQDKFPERHIFEVDEPAPEPVAAVPGSGITAAQVINTLNSRPLNDRYSLAVELIPRIGSLSLDQLNQIAETVSSSYEDNVVKFGLQYVNR